MPMTSSYPNTKTRREPLESANQYDLLAALMHVAAAVGCCAAFYLVCKACAFMDDNHHRVWTNQTVVNGEYQAWRKDLDDLSILFWFGILPLVGIGSLAGLFSSLGESLRQSKERALTCFAYSIIALAFLFYAMPSGKELSENQEQLKAAQKIYDDYHGMPGAAREYTDYLVKEGGASTKWFDQQYYDALSYPRSRLTGSVMFWGLISPGFLCSAAYLSISSHKPGEMQPNPQGEANGRQPSTNSTSGELPPAAHPEC